VNYGQLAGTGAAFSLAGVAFGQIYLVAISFAVVGVAALVIRVRFRRGRTPQDH
jgi:membrane protein implicated in regulation of membrane protease activity